MAERPSTFLKLWLLVVAVAIGVFIGSYPLFDADEGRNGEVGREMAATNDYVMPRLDGLPYLDKPIVYFAAEAAAMEVLGPTELAARLPAYLFTLLTAAVVFWFARRAWGDEAAFVAAIMFLATPLVIAFARTVIFDSALTFFMVVAIVAFYVAVERRELQVRGAAAGSWRGANLLAWAAMGFGVLTKGPVALAVPLLIAIPWAIRRKAFRALWSWGGLAIFVLVIAPWVWAISQAVPDFLHYVLVTETAQRLATKALKRTGAPWYFVPYVLGGALPWSIVALFAWRRERRNDTLMYVALWIAVPFLFFSISQSKRPQYILPVMPAIALAAAHLWSWAPGGQAGKPALHEERRRTPARIAAIVFALCGVVLLAAPFLHLKLKPEIAAGVAPAAIPLGIVAVVAAASAFFFTHRKEIALAALTLPVIAIPIAGNPLMHAIGMRRSAESFIAQIRPHLSPETEVVGVEAFTGSMAFYLRREFPVATPDGEEFTSNYVIRHYARFAGDPVSSLKPKSWLAQDLGRCCRPRIYIVRDHDAANRALLAGRGMPLIASGAHFVAYGPYVGR